MVDEAAFDDPQDAVMELVLSSDDEYADVHPRDGEELREERRVRRRELATRFLPGVDAGALFALVGSVVSLTSASVMEILAQNREVTDTFSQRSGNLGRNDPFAVFRAMNHERFLGQGVFAAAAVLIGFVTLAGWRSDRHARWSRPVAQVGLLVGLVGVVIAVLGYFDVIGGLPTPSELSPVEDFQG
ncbi:hypothetical protein [Catenulispora yoronensis]